MVIAVTSALGGDGSSAGDGNPLGDDPLLSKENTKCGKQLLYRWHFEEIHFFNPEFIHWLQKHHPESVPAGYTTPGVSSPEASSKPKATPFAYLYLLFFEQQWLVQFEWQYCIGLLDLIQTEHCQEPRALVPSTCCYLKEQKERSRSSEN